MPIYELGQTYSFQVQKQCVTHLAVCLYLVKTIM